MKKINNSPDVQISRVGTIKKIVLLSTLLLTTGIIDTAVAVVGRPLTPMSYAGVARRTVRRSAYYHYGIAPIDYNIRVANASYHLVNVAYYVSPKQTKRVPLK